MHEPPAATADMVVLPGVLGSRTLRRKETVASGPRQQEVPEFRGNWTAAARSAFGYRADEALNDPLQQIDSVGR